MDIETVITHLQIIHTWAEFASERDLQFFTAKHLEDIAQWTDDAIAMLGNGIRKIGEGEYCETIINLMRETDCNLTVGQDINNNFYCHLEDSYIGENGVLNGECGRGKTLEDAMKSYLRIIKGRKIVIHPSAENRREMFIFALEG